MYKCFAHTPYYIEHHESNEYAPGQKRKIWLRNWFYWNQHPQINQDRLVPNFYTKYTLCYLILSKWAKWASTQWKIIFSLKTDFISLFKKYLYYKFWFPRSTSNVLSTTSNWAKWVKWVLQGQKLNISLWKWFHWIQCPQIGLRDIVY